MDEIRKLEISAAARESILTEVKSIESGLYTIINVVSNELADIDDKRAKQAKAIKSFNQLKTMADFNPKTDIRQVANYQFHPSMTGGIIFPPTDSCRNALADMQALMQAGLSASFVFAFEQIDEADNVIASGRTPAAVTGANAAINNQPSKNQTWTYYIKRGDTLSAIAKRYNTTVDELVRLNHISNPNLIYAGATLLIPLSGVTGGKTTTQNNQSKPAQPQSGEIQQGGSRSNGNSTGQQKANSLVNSAIEELKQGVKEHNGDNRTKYGEWCNNNGKPWCAQFVSYCADKAGILNNGVPKYESCQDGIAFFGDKYVTAKSGYLPKAGDVAFFQDGSGQRHTGIVIAYDPNSNRMYTIEGNYGNKVAYVSTDCSNSYILGYGKVGGEDYGTPLKIKPSVR